MTRGGIAALVCFALAMPPSTVIAQTSVSGSIVGTVTNAQGQAVPNTSIEVIGPPVAGRRRALSADNGFYRLADLPPGVYALTATRDGFGPVVHSHVIVRASLTLAMDLTLDVAPVEVKLDVVATEPLLDTKSASQAMNISGEVQGRLPLSSRRDWADFLLVTPGVVSNDAGFYYAHGSSFESHVIQLDGVDLAAARQNFNGYINLSPDTTEDVHVKATGIDPSAPLGAGLVISMVSRSGADRFSGAEGLSVRPHAWNANNNPGGTTSATDAVHLDLSFGGPIQRRQWWFFSSYRYEKVRQDISRTPEQLATLAALSPGFEPFSSDSSARIPFVKITGQIAQATSSSAFIMPIGGPAFSLGRMTQPAHEHAARRPRRGGWPDVSLGLAVDACGGVLQQQGRRKRGTRLGSSACRAPVHRAVGGLAVRHGSHCVSREHEQRGRGPLAPLDGVGGCHLLPLRLARRPRDRHRDHRAAPS